MLFAVFCFRVIHIPVEGLAQQEESILNLLSAIYSFMKDVSDSTILLLRLKRVLWLGFTKTSSVLGASYMLWCYYIFDSKF